MEQNKTNAEAARRKRLVFCFDGTWNKVDSNTPTNVVQTAASVLPLDEHGIAQFVYYDQGVGTGGKLDVLTGGAMGAGLTQNLADAYRTLILNHTPGDEIFIFGFSRGAYTARSFVGLINNCGIVDRSQVDRVNEAIDFYRSRRPETKPDRLEANQFRAKVSSSSCISAAEHEWRCANVPGHHIATSIIKIAYVGVWDTVGALGVPARYRLLARLFNNHLQFHDTGIAPVVSSARHALAIDEDRSDFDASPWTGLADLNAASGKAGTAEEPFKQLWFPGTHASVGGGGDVRGLSDSALSWVWDGARLANLQLDTSPGSRIYQLNPDPAAPLDCVDWSRITRMQWLSAKLKTALWRRSTRKGPSSIDEVSIPAKRRWHTPAAALPERRPYRPASLAALSGALDALPIEPFSPPATGTFTWYVVKAGDQLGRIAQRLIGPSGKSADLMALNGDIIQDAQRIFPGRALRIPKPVVATGVTAVGAVADA